ncbi:MAG: hypothetical protein JXJ30_00855 [Halothiobacillaceae bacterium]|nr:hypothetical protein [Halothiobacillaceae bacterium]HER34563.1 hypothetical protein [Halothiobacillaceae bacterium]
MTFARLITLLLALWAPYNAVTAGVSMLDCPMNAPASSTDEPCPIEAAGHVPSQDHASDPADTERMAHCEPLGDLGGCDHCASCVVHGGLSTPTALKAAIVALPQPSPNTRVADQAAAGIPSTPFRPPLVPRSAES